jgi:phage shock protein PspC (stress-responsive transcriptional regulator)
MGDMDENPLPPYEPAGPGTTTPTGEQPSPHQPPPATSAPPRTGTDGFFDGIRRAGLFRSEERWIGGVAGGMARRLGIDPLIVRGVLGVSVLLGGIGLVVYGLGWILLPEERDGRIHLQQLFRGDFDIAVLAGIAVLLSGLSFPDRVFGPWGWHEGWGRGAIWLAIAAVVVGLIISAANRPGSQQPLPPTPPVPDEGRTPMAESGRYPTTPYPTGSYPTGSYPAPQQSAQGAGPTTSLPLVGPAGPYPAQHHGGQYAAQPYVRPYSASSPVPQVPPTAVGPQPSLPPRAPRQGPGAGVIGVVVALTLLTFAVLKYSERLGTFDGPVLLTTGGIAIILLGAAIIVSGLRGRSSGGLSALAVIGIFSLLPLTALNDADWDWDTDWRSGTSMGDVQLAPDTVTEAEEGLSMGAGDADLDLTEVPLGGRPVEVPIHVGAGDLTVHVPEGSAVSATIRIRAGEIGWLDEPTTSGVRPSMDARSFDSPAVEAGEDADILLDINVGVGAVHVVED